MSATRSVSAEMADRVFAAVESEADMEGIVTASSRRIADLVGISAMHANDSVHHLAETGRLSIVGSAGRGGLLTLALPDSDDEDER